MGHVQISRLIPAPQEAVFQYLTDLQTFPETLFGRIEVELGETPPPLKSLAEVEFVLKRFSVPVRTVIRVEQLVPSTKFSYRQISGFFKAWSHVMLLDTHDKDQTRLTDVVDFTMRAGLFGALADDLFVRADVERLLIFRAAKVAEHFHKNEHRSSDPSSEDQTSDHKEKHKEKQNAQNFAAAKTKSGANTKPAGKAKNTSGHSP